MTLATALIQGHITDLLGGGGIRASVELQVISTTPAQVRLADATTLRVGPYRRDTEPDGSISVVLPKLPQPGYEDCGWRVTIKPRGMNSVPRSFDFDLTADTTWGTAALASVNRSRLQSQTLAGVGVDTDGAFYVGATGAQATLRVLLDTDGRPYVATATNGLNVLADTDGALYIPIPDVIGSLGSIGVDADGVFYVGATNAQLRILRDTDAAPYVATAGPSDGPGVLTDTDGALYVP
jgi:hypothetical protein